MSLRRTLCAATACLAVMGAGGAALAEGGDTEQGGEARLALSAPHSLLEAVQTAEQAASGRAVEASIEGDNDRPLYVVSTMASGKVTHVAVDPQSGKVTAKEQPGFFARLIDDQEGGDRAKIALADAIASAESAADGRPWRPVSRARPTRPSKAPPDPCGRCWWPVRTASARWSRSTPRPARCLPASIRPMTMRTD